MSIQISAGRVVGAKEKVVEPLFPWRGATEQRQAVMVPISSLTLSGWVRTEGVNEEHLNSLAQLENELPPIIVHRVTRRVIDGEHRLLAARQRGSREIKAIFFDGSEDDAFLLAIRLNTAHGLPLSQADRTAAATRLIRRHPDWSDRAIAATVGLSDKTIASIRRSCAEIPHLNIRIGRDGRVRPVSSAEGRVRASDVLSRKPNATLREIAREAGISLGTARDVRNRVQRGENPVPARQRAGRSARSGPRLVSPNAVTSGVKGTAEPIPIASRARTTKLLNQLCEDPSLRYSEAGRAILRLLSLHSIDQHDWHRLAQAVPPYNVQAVADIARACASAWQQFARLLEDSGQRVLSSGT